MKKISSPFMKLHLPHLLRRALMACMALAVCPTFSADLRTNQFSLTTYTDFGQNCGRYVIGGHVNALLQSIREANGVQIIRKDGSVSYTLPEEQGMISFSGAADNGASTLLSVNTIATVAHNGVQNPTFTGADVGSANAVRYQGIEFRSGSVFLDSLSGGDLKLTRLSKIVTDADAASLYSGSMTNADGTDAFKGMMSYRTGNGEMRAEGTTIAYADTYATGGVTEFLGGTMDLNGSGVTQEVSKNTSTDPLPYAALGGDSGSGVYVWDEAAGAYAYVGAAATASGTAQNNHIQTTWMAEQLDAFTDTVDLLTTTHALTLQDVHLQEANSTVTDTSDDGVSITASRIYTRLSYGSSSGSAHISVTPNLSYTDGSGNYVSIGTWNDLSALKDTDNWYNYGSAYLNRADTATAHDDGHLTTGDLYLTRNTQLVAADSATYTVSLQGTIDTGIGYTQFSKAAGVSSADFVLTDGATTAGRGMLNTAGFVVDAGVNVHLQFANSSDYMREWRKTGEGTLTIDGTGDTWALLNVGGQGLTLLNRTDGHAAYNVLANTGSTVRIASVSQIARDFTFGNGGATLDFNGQSMAWNNAAAVADEGFSLHALTEEAVITNTAGTTALTVTDGGETFLGSFVDTADGALQLSYEGSGAWALHSIRTDLSHNAASSFTVKSGAVSLSGTNTVHGTGSATGTNAARLELANDWHYADTKANVTIEGGSFELGSHARLTGNITVNGGTFIMAENTQHATEYVEGGESLEDVTTYKEYYGLKGDVSLATNAAMQVRFSSGTDAVTTYDGSISGAGSIDVAAGYDGGVFELTGDNSALTGARSVTSGELRISGEKAFGNLAAEQWLVKEGGIISSSLYESMSNAEVLGTLDADSSGVLALTADRAAAFDLSAYGSLIIGARADKTVTYGSADAAIAAADGVWHLGGGGGTLQVAGKLSGGNLVLGNEHTQGTVILQNSANSIGNISFLGAVVLDYTSREALGGASINLSYTNRLNAHSDDLIPLIAADAAGSVTVDVAAATDLDLRHNTQLSLSAQNDTTYSGHLSLAAGADYRFGGSSATLTVTDRLSGAHGLAVDAQNTVGGTVALSKSSTLTGAVGVMGWDSAKLGSNVTPVGSVTLRLETDNALAAASGVTLSHNATLDIGSTKQTLATLVSDSSSAVTGTGSLSYTATETAQLGSIDVGTLSITNSGSYALQGTVTADSLVKKGSGTMVMQGTLSIGEVRIDAGTLKLKTGMGSTAVTVGGGAVFDASEEKQAGTLYLENGASVLAHYWTAPASRVTVLAGAEASLGVISSQGYAEYLPSHLWNLTVQSSAILNLNNKTLELGNDIAGTGTIRYTGNELTLTGSACSATLELIGRSGTGATIKAGNGTHQIAAVTVAEGRTGSFSSSDSTAWNLGSLTGGGKVSVTSGSLAVSDSVQLQSMSLDGAAAVLGGTVSFTESTESAVSVSNSGSLSFDKATLVADENAWHVDSAATLGTVTVQGSGGIIFNGAVELTGTLTNTGKLSFTGGVSISDLTGFSSTDNGYAADLRYAVIVNSGEISGVGQDFSVEGATFTYDNGSVYASMSGGATSGTYYVNSGTVSAATTGVSAATGFVVNAGGTLAVAGSVGTLTADNVLKKATGTGTLQLSTNATINSGESTLFNGTLEVTGGKLTLGYTADYASADISSLASLRLSGGSVVYGGNSTTSVNNLDVAAAATLSISSTGGKTLSFTGTTELAKDLTVSTTYSSSLSFAHLSGAGNLSIHGASDTTWGTNATVAIESLEGYTGTLSFDKQQTKASSVAATTTTATIATGDEPVTLAGLKLSNGATGSLTAGAKADLGAVVIDSSSGALALSGSDIALSSLSNSGTVTMTAGSKLSSGHLSLQAAEGGATIGSGKVSSESFTGAELEGVALTVSGGSSTYDADRALSGTTPATTYDVILEQDAASSFTVADGGYVGTYGSTLHNVHVEAGSAIAAMSGYGSSSYENAEVAGDLYVQSGATLTLTGAVSLSGKVVNMGSLNLSSGGTTFTADDGASFTGSLSVTEAGDLALAGGRAEGMIIDLAAGTTLTVTNSVMAASCRVTDDAATLRIEGEKGLTLEVETENVTASTTGTYAGGSATVLTLNNLADVAIEGSKLTLDLSSYAADSADYLGVQMADVSYSSTDTPLVFATYADGQTVQGSISDNTLYFAMTPEPATTTLSLLALAALAARRRR